MFHELIAALAVFVLSFCALEWRREVRMLRVRLARSGAEEVTERGYAEVDFIGGRERVGRVRDVQCGSIRMLELREIGDNGVCRLYSWSAVRSIQPLTMDEAIERTSPHEQRAWFGAADEDDDDGPDSSTRMAETNGAYPVVVR